MRVHFIAIGGSAMHNLAIALHKKGFHVTGSDDKIFEPSKSRLQNHGLLPVKEGWSPDTISEDLDAVILGMHARSDNPELLKAQKLNLKVYSYPEYLYEQTKNKKRVVIAGSHGKTTITSMLLHVLKETGRKFDFMVGAHIKGFDTMVELSNESDVAVFEGDEYLSSPIDLRPKFLWYKPRIALVTGVAWDHVNVFPTEEEYNHQFELFAQTLEPGGSFIFYQQDPVLQAIAHRHPELNALSYNEVETESFNGETLVVCDERNYVLKIFGHHNFQNLAGALLVAKDLGVTEKDFWESMQNFEGAARRLQVLSENENASVFYDFAHAPSKVKATVAAVKDQYPHRQLLAVVELHTFSSLNREFLPQYEGAMENADEAVVFFDPEVVAHKKLEEVTIKDVEHAFAKKGLKVFTDGDKLHQFLAGKRLENSNLLLMTSGNLAGIDVNALAEEVLS
ncbi:UDP-N-acetylmuramate--L-alanine ligase [Marinilabilia salmonicolor]|uniref:UDP-N-acetylmuramate: L-alanyl-gamma-D-glutamyl-meso-diaminopimelate ligase n=1 Tax=Marinilabilia salmonicolor TaxID=989 RepID=A0A368VIC9_9BACT|nr:Mur ligase family protein [Marinilabilia salmonicolor]RCW39404.1 UDP-N-acetylmuramate: L-alanyl-gamma-D-glutamyl-meso-diaminopimelate ligase [Marinilabilia salmonicolor]